jgi:hypothetical protein
LTNDPLAMLNFARLVLLSLWLGAALYFSAVVAPTSFTVLRSFDLPNASEIAGTIVTRALAVINIGGFLIGILLLLTLFVRPARSRTALLVEFVSLAAIIMTTSLGNWVVAARMRALRAAMVLPIDQIAVDDPRRVAFNSLHGYSVSALGIAMIAGLVVIVLICRGLRSGFQR